MSKPKAHVMNEYAIQTSDGELVTFPHPTIAMEACKHWLIMRPGEGSVTLPPK